MGKINIEILPAQVKTTTPKKTNPPMPITPKINSVFNSDFDMYDCKYFRNAYELIRIKTPI